MVGSALLALGALGLVHIGAGLPAEPERWHEGGGAVGYLAAIPLASGLTVWVAVPVLLLLSGYAFLLLIDTPLREVPDLLRRLTGRELADDDEHAADGDHGDDRRDDFGDDAAPADPARRRPSRRRQGSFAEPPAAAEPPAEPDAPPAAPASRSPDPAVPPRRSRPPRPPRRAATVSASSCAWRCARRPATRPTRCRRATCCPRARLRAPAAARTTR